MLSETITERIRRFREDRISKLLANETPVYFDENDTDKMILHLIPIDAFSPAQRYSFKEIVTDQLSLTPLFANSYDRRTPNLDGILTSYKVYSSAGESNSYVQLYRNGVIEAACGNLVEPDRIGRDAVHIDVYQNELMRSISNYTNVLKSLSIEPPFYLFLTLTGVKGAILWWQEAGPFARPQIDRDVLMIPEICISHYEAAQEALKECFEFIWNAGGHSKPLI
jgi:hypothetical protein